jgi:IPT/TIG domain
VRAGRPRQDNDRALSPQALAAIAEAARRSREARVGPEPGRTRPAEPRTTRTTRPVTPPTPRPVEESVAGTPDRPLGPQGAMARTQTRDAPVVPIVPSGPPTQPGRTRESSPVSHQDPVVAAPVPATVPARPAQRGGPGGTGTSPPPSGGTRWVGAEPPIQPFGPAEAPSPLESRVPARGRPRRPPGAGERRLRWAVGLTAVLLVVVVAAVVGTRSGSGNQAPGRAASAGAVSGAPATRPSTVPTTGASGGGTTAPTATSMPTSIPPVVPGGMPVLSAIQPSTGSAGQRVTVSGSNFLSSSGQITAAVDGQVAPVTCPDQQTCTIVIPADTGSTASAPVTITTDSGTSNALVFTYGTLDATGSCGCKDPHPGHGPRRRHGHGPPGH